MDVTSNVFDEIRPTLDQTVFNGIELRPNVRKFNIKLYFRALDKQLGVIGTEWADVYLTGSLTTYQYNETSDADHSVFPDYDRIWKHLGIDPDTCRKQLIEMSIEHLDGTFIPGTYHPIQYFVMPYGTMPHDVFKPGLRSGYSLFDKEWIVEPERSRVHDIQQEFPDVYSKAVATADKMSQMLDIGNFDAAKELWHNVHAKRMLDQRAGLGDFSEGNIILKWLLHEGLVDRLRNEAGMVIQTNVKIGHTSALPHLWDDRVTTKVIYDFKEDRIILGTQATLPDLPDSKIVGEYKDGMVTLFEADKQWINPTYFRRLWHYSYPQRQLKDVYFRRDSGDEYKLKSLPRKRKKDG